MNGFKSLFKPVMGVIKGIQMKAKILVAYLQVVGSFATTFTISFPHSFTSFISTFELVDLNVMSMISLDCMAPLDFFDKLVLATLAPFALVFGIVAVAMVAWVVFGIVAVA